jgi:hypothetical protein
VARAPLRPFWVTTAGRRLVVPSLAPERGEWAQTRHDRTERIGTLDTKTTPRPVASRRGRSFRQSEDEKMRSPCRDDLRSFAQEGTWSCRH